MSCFLLSTHKHLKVMNNLFCLSVANIYYASLQEVWKLYLYFPSEKQMLLFLMLVLIFSLTWYCWDHFAFFYLRRYEQRSCLVALCQLVVVRNVSDISTLDLSQNKILVCMIMTQPFPWASMWYANRETQPTGTGKKKNLKSWCHAIIISSSLCVRVRTVCVCS